MGDWQKVKIEYNPNKKMPYRTNSFLGLHILLNHTNFLINKSSDKFIFEAKAKLTKGGNNVE